MISALLKKVMLECKLKQVELAEVLGASVDRVKGLTSGRIQNLTRQESEALIGKLDIRADWLITGEGAMFQDGEETQDEFVDRMQAIKRMGALIKAMPLREFTRMRLCAVMTGELEADGAILAEAIRRETLGIDFVTGKPIEGVAPVTLPLPADEQMWLDCYLEWSPEVKKRELRRAMGVSPSGTQETEFATNPSPQIGGTHSQHASGDGSIQIGTMGHTPTKRKR